MQGKEIDIIKRWREDEREEILDEVEDEISPDSNIKNCVFWTGELDKDGYPQMCKGLPGRVRSSKIAVYRLIYFNAYPSHMFIKSPGKKIEVSHICHDKLCINWQHLSLEYKITNRQRNKCKKYGVCLKHHCGRPCLL